MEITSSSLDKECAYLENRFKNLTWHKNDVVTILDFKKQKVNLQYIKVSSRSLATGKIDIILYSTSDKYNLSVGNTRIPGSIINLVKSFETISECGDALEEYAKERLEDICGEWN